MLHQRLEPCRGLTNGRQRVEGHGAQRDGVVEDGAGGLEDFLRGFGRILDHGRELGQRGRRVDLRDVQHLEARRVPLDIRQPQDFAADPNAPLTPAGRLIQRLMRPCLPSTSVGVSPAHWRRGMATQRRRATSTGVWVIAPIRSNGPCPRFWHDQPGPASAGADLQVQTRHGKLFACQPRR